MKFVPWLEVTPRGVWGIIWHLVGDIEEEFIGEFSGFVGETEGCFVGKIRKIVVGETEGEFVEDIKREFIDDK